MTGDFPTQRASNAEIVSIWWRHHETCSLMFNALLSVILLVWFLAYNWTSILWFLTGHNSAATVGLCCSTVQIYTILQAALQRLGLHFDVETYLNLAISCRKYRASWSYVLNKLMYTEVSFQNMGSINSVILTEKRKGSYRYVYVWCIWTATRFWYVLFILTWTQFWNSYLDQIIPVWT